MGEMIITGGENVWPVAVERVLNDLCGVCRCGTPRPSGSVTAIVVRANKPSLEMLREAVGNRCLRFVRRLVEYVDQLPGQPLKIQRHLLCRHRGLDLK